MIIFFRLRFWILIFFTTCGIQSILGQNSTWEQEEFVIGSWRDPLFRGYNEPSYDLQGAISKIQYLVDANFNLLSGVNDNTDNSFQDNCFLLDLLSSNFENEDISLIIYDDDYINDYGYKPHEFDVFDEIKADNMIDKYHNIETPKYNKMYGYGFGDEPTKELEKKDNYSKWIKHINNNQLKPSYVNLLPRYYYGFTSNQDYESYLDSYMDNIDSAQTLRIVSVDYYPFRSSFRTSYFYNLKLLREKAIENDLSFWFIPYTTSFVHDAPEPNANHLRFMVFSPIAYGAKGIIYWYYNGHNSANDGLFQELDSGFNTNEKYEIVKSINNYVKNIIGPIVIGSENIGVYHKSNTVLNNGYNFSSNYLINEQSPIINNVDNDNIMVSVFKSNDDQSNSKTNLEKDNYYLFIVNKDLNRINNLKVSLKGNTKENTFTLSRISEYNSTGGKKYNTPKNINYNNSRNITEFEIDNILGGECIVLKVNKVVTVPSEYDGDRKADLSVKCDDGRWLINFSGSENGFYSGWNFSSSVGAYGGASCHPVPADYDGDGKADLSVKCDDGRWLINFSGSENGFYSGWNFSSSVGAYGGASCHPVPADYDGDGKADLSVKCDDGRWLINFSGSENGFYSGWNFSSSVGAYGGASCRPVPADYDGDGKADLSVKCDDGRWLINFSGSENGFYSGWNFSSSVGAYGGKSCHPVPADYDGDGKADLSVKCDDGRWLINFSGSENGFYSGWNFSSSIGAYGGASCHPVPADYDGDGKADLSVKCDDGRWLINFSGSENGFYSGWNFSSSVGAYGGASCHPVPADYDGDGKVDLLKSSPKNILLVEENFSMENDISIYPNPVNDVLNIEIGVNYKDLAIISLIDINNRVIKNIIYDTLIEGNEFSINVSDVKDGLYFVNIIMGENSHTSKIIVQH